MIEEIIEESIAAFKHLFAEYPVYTIAILLGFAVLFYLAFTMPRRVPYRQIVYRYPEQQYNVPQRVYEQPPQPVYEQPQPARKKPRRTLENLDLVDNWGFLE